MDFPCLSEINVRNENALRFAVVTRPAPVIEYLKTIASLIGASHILGVFEDNNFVKVYFDEKKYVDTLIRSGIHVLGHHIKVEYVVPPGSKVILSNVDPVVSNYDLINLMSMFGRVASPVFRSPISDDIELCHIDYGVRYVYINLNMPVPEVLEFKYGDEMCKINMKLDESLPAVEYVKKEPSESNTTESSSSTTAFDDNIEPINVDDDDDRDATDPIVVSVQSATGETDSEKQNESTIKPNETQTHIEANNPVTNKRDSYKTRHAKSIKISQFDKKVKHSVKYKNRKPKKFKISKRKGQIKNVTCIKESPKTPLNIQSSSPASLSSPDENSTLLADISDNFINENCKSVLDSDKLNLFLDEVRFLRAPIEVVKKYLGPNFDSNTLLCLIKQLNDLKKETEDLSFKVRIRRLINNLKSFLNA